MKIGDIRKGDIVTYRSGKTNNVNRVYKYSEWYKEDFTYKRKYRQLDIMKIQRYVKFLCFYRLKTIYKRVK